MGLRGWGNEIPVKMGLLAKTRLDSAMTCHWDCKATNSGSSMLQKNPCTWDCTLNNLKDWKALSGNFGPGVGQFHGDCGGDEQLVRD